MSVIYFYGNQNWINNFIFDFYEFFVVGLKKYCVENEFVKRHQTTKVKLK